MLETSNVPYRDDLLLTGIPGILPGVYGRALQARKPSLGITCSISGAEFSDIKQIG